MRPRMSILWTIPQIANHLRNSQFAEDMFFCEVGLSDELCLIFGHKPTMRQMQKHCSEVFTTIFCVQTDQTFCFMYQIVCCSNLKVVPLMQVMMTYKNYESFRNVLLRITREFHKFSPNTVHLTKYTDEETAWKEVYPGVRTHHMFWDYFEKIHRHIQDLPQLNHASQVLLTSLIALPLVPRNTVNLAFCLLLMKGHRRGVLEDLVPTYLYVFKKWIYTRKLMDFSLYNAPFKANNISYVADKMLLKSLETLGPHIAHFEEAISDYGVAAGERVHLQTRFLSLQHDGILKRKSEDLMRGRISMMRFLRDISIHVQNVFNGQVDQN